MPLRKSSTQKDALARYMEDLSKHPMLTPAEEQHYGALALAGDKDAQDVLVRANLRFVVTVAKRYQKSGLDLLELISAGNEGLIKAARKFDPTRGVKFVSYAHFWISQQIQKEIDSAVGTVRATQTQQVRNRRVRKMLLEAGREGQKLSVEKIAEETGYTVDRIQEALEYNVNILSLDAPLDNGDRKSATLGQVLGDDGRFEEEEAEREVMNAINNAIEATLTEREAHIIRLYFGLDGNPRWPLSDIGATLGISRERARQLKERAIEKLRSSSAASSLLEVFTPSETAVPVDLNAETPAKRAKSGRLANLPAPEAQESPVELEEEEF